MRVTLADKMKEAFAKAGQDIPESRPVAKPVHAQPIDKNPARNSGGANRSADKSKKSHPDRGKVNSQVQGSVGHGKQSVSGAVKAKVELQGKSNSKKAEPSYDGLNVYREGVSGRKPAVVKKEVDFGCRVLLSESSAPCWSSVPKDSEPKLLELGLSGQQVQPTPVAGVDLYTDRELAVGLDFGSSSVKVVVGDGAIDKAFAVQFRAASGVLGYLLPCRVYKSGSVYSLSPGGFVIADLKLSLLANPESAGCQEQVVAFLALVIRRVRAWFFCFHEPVYRSSNIFWRMALGLPTANHLEPELACVFRLLGAAAWILAGSEDSEITESGVRLALRRVDELDNGEPPSPSEDIEISVVPEIAAQIYGYVASERFDRKANNNYMMVDIGAGTVDAALFHVQPGRGGKWDFGFFTATVEPRGTVNLHRHRLRWWEEVVRKDYPQRHDLISSMCDGWQVTDIQESIPDSFCDYFSDAVVSFGEKCLTTDHVFYSGVFSQVANRTYYAASEHGHLPRESLTEIPVYLCGGGARLHFYYKLRSSLNNHPSLPTWMRAVYRRLTLPQGLIAPEVLQVDYDRLSVAYGLSFLNVGKVLKSVPKAKIPVNYSDSWRDNYIDK